MEQARSLAPDLAVIALNAKEPGAVAALMPWCGHGRTVALLGSSGVGKSTIANGLGTALQDTGGIREDDAKGRHTTTRRHMLALPSGGSVSYTHLACLFSANDLLEKGELIASGQIGKMCIRDSCRDIHDVGATGGRGHHRGA